MVTEEKVWDVLRTCYDPEIPVNIVDLGLVYSLVVEQGDSGGARVKVKMTLTAPGCGMGPVIAGDAQRKIAGMKGVESADVEVVWDPPWSPSFISAEGRKKLGMD
jgi:metal-sulfur cluster biosynthetic enzyme